MSVALYKGSSPPAEHIKNHSKGKACSLSAALALLHPLSLVLTLPSLYSLLGRTISHRQPWPPCTPSPRASQDGFSSAAVAVSPFSSPALCLWKGLRLPIMPAGSGRPTSSSSTSGIAPTPWLKWYSHPRVLHGGIWGPTPLLVLWLLAFGIPSSFPCLSPEKNKVHFQLRWSFGVWSRSIACWLCSQGKLLPLLLLLPKGKAAPGNAQLLLFKKMLPKWANYEIWH